MSTIAAQLSRSVAPGIVLALLSGGIVLDLLISDRLENEFDAVLVTRARTLAALTEYESGELEIERYDHVLPGYADPREPDYFEIRSDSGKRLLASPALSSGIDLAGGRDGDDGWSRYAELELPDGRPGRRFTLTFTPATDDEDSTGGDTVLAPSGSSSIAQSSRPPAAPVVLTVAVSRESLDSLLGSVRLSLIATGAGVMVMLFLAARRAIRSRLAPLAAIGRQVDTLTIDHPEQRLVLDPSSEEIDRLTARFNELLQRVDTALERERRFSGDVAHELRTPIAELKSLMEVRARFPEDAELATHFEHDQRQSVERMERTVTQLLALGRAEAHSEPMGRKVELAGMIDESLARFQALANERALLLEPVIASHVRPVVGGHYWQGIIDNLIQNACTYATPGSTVRVALHAIGDACQLRISNPTDELDSADLERLFDRLWRKEASRSATQHSGLGLALVSAYARALGLVIDVELDDGRFTIAVGRPGAQSLARRQVVAPSPSFPVSRSAGVRSVAGSSAQ